MRCKHFGRCGSCIEFEGGYEAQLERKVDKQIAAFIDIYDAKIDIYRSSTSHYRSRAEFRVWHTGGEISLAMNSINRDGVVLIQECPMLIRPIESIAFKLLDELKNLDMTKKLFSVEFLSTTASEVLVTLIYHRKLDEQWREKAQTLSKHTNTTIIGRSKKQRVVLQQDYLIETLKIDSKELKFKQVEGSFTQPNTEVNIKMLEWVRGAFGRVDADLLELYCGNGNFTIALSENFNKILATEISKTSIAAARYNKKLNNILNIEFVRLSASELVQALNAEREFRRLKEIDLTSYNFKAIFVDPPRAGLDSDGLDFIKGFEQIVYISCNPITLKRDLLELNKTHHVEKMALFDQFAYTSHVEMGVKLLKR